MIPDKGPAGWVASQQVTVISQPPAAAPGIVESSSPPCSTDLDGCPVNGCATAQSKRALFNATKRRLPSATAAPASVDFADLGKLQSRADNLVGSGSELSAADRALLKNLIVKSGTVKEGSKVQITGFLATGPLKPHPNTGESVNCRLKKPPENDFHISLVEAKQGTEFEGIVVEMIPQKRPAGWTLEKLESLRQSRQRVLVIGALFYDNDHVVNDDRDNELSGQPRRMALWEVHPIASFLVCKDANGNCDPSKPADWTKLENFQ